jgi:6-pyruvoyltetrahydropterin/6-carboxytetrahydropterin synthase
MAYRICKTLEIDNAHLLSKHAGNCRFPHGHTRRIEVVLEADRLDANDMVVDFARLKEWLAEETAAWDHALCVNRADPHFVQLEAAFRPRVVGFEGRDPTTEVLAAALYAALQARLAAVLPAVRLRRVRVWETSTSWAEYAEA